MNFTDRQGRNALDIARAARPGQRGLEMADAAEIRDDIERTIDSYAGIGQLRAKGDQFQWGGQRLCEGGQFPLPDGRACFVTSEPPDAREQAGRFRLGTRRGKQFNSIVQSEVDQLTGKRAPARSPTFSSRGIMSSELSPCMPSTPGCPPACMPQHSMW